MTSNVELQKPVITPVTDDPSIDIYTQRPRLPHRQRPELVGLALRERPEVFFSRGQVTKYDGQFHKSRYTYKTSGNNLVGKSPDLLYIGDEWSRYPDSRYDGSRAGAYFPWPRYKAGERIVQRLHEEPVDTMLETELYRRPPTNLPGNIKMAFGRAAPGYYAPKYPNKETWFHSNVLHNREPCARLNFQEKTREQYEVCDLRQTQYYMGLGNTTEYQDRYLAHIPTRYKL